MEILYGIVLLIVFIIGLGMGLLIPFFIKKYVNQIIEKTEIKEKTEINNNPMSLTKKIVGEWFYGDSNIEEGDRQ